MSRNKKESYFWTSYSDLMTSLFFVMLILFIISIVLYSNANKKLINTENKFDTTKEQLDKIIEIDESIKSIDEKHFRYNEKYKRHTLVNIDVKFPKSQADIYSIDIDTRIKLIDAGKSIKEFIEKKSPKEAKYLLIIEGQASKDGYDKNDELSYKRALSLYKLWKDREIDFDKEKCEVIVSGSGCWSNFREVKEAKNQRFVIHIIPKPGIISYDNSKITNKLK